MNIHPRSPHSNVGVAVAATEPAVLDPTAVGSSEAIVVVIGNVVGVVVVVAVVVVMFVVDAAAAPPVVGGASANLANVFDLETPPRGPPPAT